jgi:hypothetical protein
VDPRAGLDDVEKRKLILDFSHRLVFRQKTKKTHIVLEADVANIVRWKNGSLDRGSRCPSSGEILIFK